MSATMGCGFMKVLDGDIYSDRPQSNMHSIIFVWIERANSQLFILWQYESTIRLCNELLSLDYFRTLNSIAQEQAFWPTPSVPCIMPPSLVFADNLAWFTINLQLRIFQTNWWNKWLRKLINNFSKSMNCLNSLYITILPCPRIRKQISKHFVSLQDKIATTNSVTMILEFFLCTPKSWLIPNYL